MNLPAGGMLCALAVGLAGCADEPASRSDVEPGAPPTEAAPADSLALALAGGTQIWYTLARPALDSTGAACTERALEIRSGGRRTPVPLFYTAEPPEALGDSQVRARLWTDCRPGPTYLIDLRTGQPIPERKER